MSRRAFIVAALVSVALSHPAAARTVESAPATESLGHADAHLDVSFGLGLLTVGAGAVVGYRAPIGLRVEAALGTMGIASGKSVGAGYSVRMYDGVYFTAEVPLMLYGLGFRVEPLDFESECDDAPDCDNDPDAASHGVAGAVASGLDVIFGASRSNHGRFVLGLRGGVMGFGGGSGGTWPMAQMNFGATF